VNGRREVRNQADFDAATAAGDVAVVTEGDVRLETSGTQRPIIELLGKAVLLLITGGSSVVKVLSWGSSTINAVSWEGIFKVVAKAYSQLKVRGAVTVVAAATVAIVILGGEPKIEGGGFIQRRDISTPHGWCDYFGVEISAGHALLFKVVNAKFRTHQRNFEYAPGSAPVAMDWDGGLVECGGGLYFSPTPGHADAFVGGASRSDMRYVACPVLLTDIVVHHDGQYPEKVKAPRVALPCWEVDRAGKPVPGAVVSWPPAGSKSEGAPRAKARTKSKTKRRSS
jgi:hypothetical protein